MKPIFPFTQQKAGRWYYRLTWTVNGKRKERYIPLPADPGSQEFAQAYWKIRSGKTTIDRPARYTWADLIRHYKLSRKWRELKPGTMQSYERVISALVEKNGKKDPTAVSRAEIRAIHEKYADTPRKADSYLQIMSILFNFARHELDWPCGNPTEGIKLFGTQREMLPWPEWLQKSWVTTCENTGAERALIAYHLGVGTGQRASDLLAMEWSHFNDGFVDVVQEKTGTRMSIYCPNSLRTFLASIPRRGRFVLAKNLTEPLTYSALENEFRRVRDLIGEKAKPYSMHGWRKLAAVQLAEAGASDAEIAAVTGHKALSMVQHYRKGAGQKALSKRAQKMRE